MGINRSALVIGYYLIRWKSYKSKDVLELLQKANEKRGESRVLINRTFRMILIGNFQAVKPGNFRYSE